MKTKRTYTNGILTGVIGMLLIILTLSATNSKTENNAQFEFYDLKTTKGVIFNKSTGELKYETIRKEPLEQVYELRINGYQSSTFPIHIKQEK